MWVKPRSTFPHPILVLIRTEHKSRSDAAVLLRPARRTSPVVQRQRFRPVNQGRQRLRNGNSWNTHHLEHRQWPDGWRRSDHWRGQRQQETSPSRNLTTRTITTNGIFVYDLRLEQSWRNRCDRRCARGAAGTAGSPRRCGCAGCIPLQCTIPPERPRRPRCLD